MIAGLSTSRPVSESRQLSDTLCKLFQIKNFCIYRVVRRFVEGTSNRQETLQSGYGITRG